MRRLPLLLLLALVPGAARAHVVTIFPSTCAAVIGLSVPAASISAVVDAPAASEFLRLVYDPEANPERSRVQVCPADPLDPPNRCGAIVPRAFTIGSASGMMAFPATFALRVLTSGDLDASAVPLAVGFDGGSATLPVELTTGTLTVGPTLTVGAPIDAAGGVTLVGKTSGGSLPAPLGGADLLLSVSCTLSPVPDLDQFALAPRLEKAAGLVGTKRTRLTYVLASETSLPGDFSAAATMLRVSAAGSPVITVDLPTGLQAGARGSFTGTSAEGIEVTVEPLRRRFEVAYRILVRGPGIPGPFASAAGEVLLDAGGLVARRTVALRANRAGTRLRIGKAG